VPAPEASHPYGVDVALVLGSDVELEMDALQVEMPLIDDVVFRLRQRQRNPREEAANLKRVAVRLEAFRSAGAAEEGGKRLILGLFWAAVSKRFTFGVERWVGDFPFSIFERGRAAGLSVRAEGRAFFRVTPDEFLELVRAGFSSTVEASPSLFASLELYAAARMELTERARFITLVTALEALCVQREYGSNVDALVRELVGHAERFQGIDDDALKASLIGRIRQLRTESVRQAILRTVRENISEGDAVGFVDEAYGTRSKILHEGVRIESLHETSSRFDDVLRRIYSSLFGLSLRTPTNS
jgi:hypothetical protein